MPDRAPRHLALGAALLACVPASARDCAAVAPSTVAVELYRHHRDFIHNEADSPLLAPSLRKLVKANISQNLSAGDVGAVDWDFWSDAQDGEVGAEAAPALVSQAKGKAVVRLRYQFSPSPERPSQLKVTDVHLVQDGGRCWLVDDLLHEKLSLRTLLRRATRPVQQYSDGSQETHRK